jgi:hypothetical protein
MDRPQRRTGKHGPLCLRWRDEASLRFRRDDAAGLQLGDPLAPARGTVGGVLWGAVLWTMVLWALL